LQGFSGGFMVVQLWVICASKWTNILTFFLPLHVHNVPHYGHEKRTINWWQ